jgi:hypothetical protein
LTPASASLRKGRRAGAGLILHPDGDRRPHQVPDACGRQHRLGGGLVVGDERHDAAVPMRCRAQQQVDAAAGHRLTQAGQLTRLVVQLHRERAHLELPRHTDNDGAADRRWRGLPDRTAALAADGDRGTHRKPSRPQTSRPVSSGRPGPAPGSNPVRPGPERPRSRRRAPWSKRAIRIPGYLPLDGARFREPDHIESSLLSVSSGCLGFLRGGRGVRSRALKGSVRLTRGAT